MTKPKMISKKRTKKKREENQKEDLVTVQKNIEDSAKSGLSPRSQTETQK